MTVASRSALKSLLRGVAWLLFAVAGLTFWVGGTAISEFTKADRMLAEMLGTAITVASVVLGLVAKNTADDLDEGEDSSVR